MRISYVTSEVHPFSKTGGLADVSDALPAALARLGANVTVFSPFYRSVREWAARHGGDRELELPGTLHVGDQNHPLQYRIVEGEGRRWVFVVNPGFYDRASLYVDENGRDYPDSVARFAFFCRAVLEYDLQAAESPDLYHVHDWQASLLPVYLDHLYTSWPGARPRTVLTIHNLGYQGLFARDQLRVTGLPDAVFHMEALEFYGGLNLLKGGIVFADAVTTVSPSYAGEIQTDAHGRGLQGVLRRHGAKLRGILNGIDQQRWDPSADPHLRNHYDAENLAGKAKCKRALQREMGLPQRGRAFLLGVVSRFDVQKGIPLIVEAWRSLGDLDLQIVLLGAGDRAIEEQVELLARREPRRVAFRGGFDEPLAHRIEAGADAFLMPSVYEPCGLNQMYSQRYGTVPIVRATGGLRDTVVDYTPERLAAGEASGFVFAAFDAGELAAAIRRAAASYFSAPADWQRLVAHIMRLDHSWDRSAHEYLQLYREVAGRRLYA